VRELVGGWWEEYDELNMIKIHFIYMYENSIMRLYKDSFKREENRKRLKNSNTA
jgi:hypothetical protein